MRHHRTIPGFTLVEVMMVILVVAVLAALVIPSANTGINDRLHGVGATVAADMARGRSLAVTNNSKYRFTFSPSTNAYYLEHTGSDSALNPLPSTPFPSSSDTSTRQYTQLSTLALGGNVQLIGVVDGSNVQRTTLEFGNYGETTEADATTIWLSAGSGSARQYLSVSINPVTGLATMGSISTTGPSAGAIAVTLN